MARWRVNFWRRKRREAELDDELRSHLEMAARERVERGEAIDEAKHAARREFGNVELVREVTKDGWGWRWLEDFVEDARYGLRMLRKNPGFTAVAVLTLALGIGANTAIFSAVNGILLRPLAFPQSERLYLIHEIVPQWMKFYPSLAANLNNFKIWQKECRAFEQVAIAEAMDMDLSGEGGAEQVHGVRASASLFDTLGVRPAMGRGFLPQEDEKGNDNVVVLTDSFWRNRFHADPSLLGRAITLDGTPHVVAGILPSSFHFPNHLLGSRRGSAPRADFFVPLGGPRFYEEGPIAEFDFVAIARLKPGISPEEALAELNVIQGRIARDAKQDLDLRAELMPLNGEVVGPSRRGLLLLLAAVGAVLLMVCVNLANLLLARAPARMRESAVRAALGATRSRLVRQMLTEFLFLALAGGALGAALAAGGVDWLVHSAPVDLPRLDEVAVDARVLGFAAILSLLTGAIFGVLPALRIAKSDPQETLKSGGSTGTETRRTRRMRESLIGFEVSICTLLLVVAGLLASSLFHILRVERGYDVERVLAADINLPERHYADLGVRQRFYGRALDALRALPGVESAGWITILPLEGQGSVSHISLPGGATPVEQRPFANYRAVSPGYFETMGIRLLKGRGFTEDDLGRKRIILSENLAERFWPGENPVGRECEAEWGQLQRSEVIGVVQDIRTVRLDQPPIPMVYVPDSYGQMEPGAPQSASIVIRTMTDPSAAGAAVREVIRSLDADVPIVALRPMTQLVAASVAPQRFQMSLAMIFAASALCLAGLGIFGVVAYSVEQRRRELGLRMALGARTRDIRVQVLRQGMIPVGLGFVGGAAGAFLVGRLLQSFLFGVTPGDAITLLSVTLVVGVAGLLACWIPAWRATKVDPMVALRYE
jgi:predicted permease